MRFLTILLFSSILFGQISIINPSLSPYPIVYLEPHTDFKPDFLLKDEYKNQVESQYWTQYSVEATKRAGEIWENGYQEDKVNEYIDNQKIVYDNGVAYAINKGDNSIVMVGMYHHHTLGQNSEINGPLIEIVITIQNTSNESILFDPFNIKARILTGKAQAGFAKKIDTKRPMSRNDIRKIFERKQAWNNLASVLDAFATGYEAGKKLGGGETTSTTTFSGSTYGDSFSGTATTTKTPTYESQATQLQQTRVSLQGAQSDLSNIIMGKHTLFPGDVYHGSVIIKPDAKKIWLNIYFDMKIGEDNYSFGFGTIR